MKKIYFTQEQLDLILKAIAQFEALGKLGETLLPGEIENIHVILCKIGRAMDDENKTINF